MKDAVSAIFVCDNRIFSIRRQDYLSAFPGYTAFPGGKVDVADKNRAYGCPFLKDFDATLMRALCREIQEELGFDLEGAIESGEVIDFFEIGVAITPEFNPYRFKTHFYKITLKSLHPFQVDENEAAHALWEPAQALLERFNKGELLAVPPTVKLIRTLAADIGHREYLSLTLPHNEKTQVPWIESIRGVLQFLPRSNTFPPAKRTNSFLIGDEGQKRILIDPSPKDVQELNKFKSSLAGFKFDQIFLTHHHPDHHEMAPRMAREFGASMGMSEDTHGRIIKKWGEDYFKDISIEYYSEGDIVTHSLGSPVRVLEVPGHDEGQLALAPESGNWVLVGDLIQSVGTVVIGAPEGDMAKYLHSLRKIIYLAPRFIIPSHGIALGGTHKLEMTLKHRLHREKQIMLLLDQGKGQQEILEIVYKGLAPELHRYAIKTIQAHITKIQAFDASMTAKKGDIDQG